MKKFTVLMMALSLVCILGGIAYADLNDGLVGYWNFDEGQGNVLYDQSENNYDGTIYGATWSDGICGSALDFDGDGDYVELPDIDLVPNPFTICGWVNIQDNTLSGSYFILGRTHGNVPGEYWLAFRREDEIDQNYVLALDVIYDIDDPFWKGHEMEWTNQSSPEGWHFYCGSWDGVAKCSDFGEGIKLYIDGELQTNVTANKDGCILYPRTGTHLTAIGAYEGREPPTPAPRSGFAIDPIDEVRIYDRELSAEEIQQLYQDGISCATATLSCTGFDPPMDSGPVTVKGKKRALPIKAYLYDNGDMMTDQHISAAPVIQILFQSGSEGQAIDVTDEALAANEETEGNQFFCTEDGKWRYNLKVDSKTWSAPGTYNIFMVTGDDTEYTINPKCEASFVIE